MDRETRALGDGRSRPRIDHKIVRKPVVRVEGLRECQRSRLSGLGGILQEAAGQRADMLVVIARRHSLLGGLFHRSATAQLLRESAIPVLVLPATE